MNRRASLVVSINAFNGKCLDEITGDVSDIVIGQVDN